MTKLNIFTDGGSRGNPGPAACAFVLQDETGSIIYQESKYLGIATNNVAEYQGLRSAIDYINSHQDQFAGYESYTFHLDSELVVRQVIGQYKVKDSNMLTHYQEVIKNLGLLSKPYKFLHVPRSSNKNADHLLNLELDKSSK